MLRQKISYTSFKETHTYHLLHASNIEIMINYVNETNFSGSIQRKTMDDAKICIKSIRNYNKFNEGRSSFIYII